MREKLHELCEKGRVSAGRFATGPGDRCGAFHLRHPSGSVLRVLSSDGSGWRANGLPLPVWEHVSVSTPARTPTWAEMAWVKGLFFRDDEAVVEFHPPKANYVNAHEHTLHLWRPVGVEIPVPPVVCV